TEGTRKGVAMTGAATLRLGDEVLAPDRPFSLRWAWRWRSVAGQVADSTASSRWHGLIRRRTIPHRAPAPRWRATARWAGAPCWPRTRLPGTRAGPPATC